MNHEIRESMNQLGSGLCCLCGTWTDYCGALLARGDSFGVLSPGKQRVIAYRLCPDCRSQPGWDRKIEDHILSVLLQHHLM